MAFEHLSIKTPKVGNKKPTTGGPLPPLTDSPTTPPATTTRNKIGQENFQRAFQQWFDNKWRNGGHTNIFAGFDGKAAGSAKDPNATNKPGTTKPPATPTPQWAFKPNPLDQPSYVTPMGNAAAYTINLPAQQWMFDPATYGQGAPPQWYGQPVVPNSQPPFRY